MVRILTLAFLWCLIPTISSTHAQTTSLTLEECYTFARQNYPLTRQHDLIAQTEVYSIENASKALKPQVSIMAQASYQSEVTQVPIEIPGMNIPVISKDQYKLYVEATQVLYDGGVTTLQKQSISANSEIEKQKLEVELYKLKERVNQVYFGILLIDEQIVQTNLLLQDIESGKAKIEASIQNGTALKSNLDVLKVEILKTKQRLADLKASRQSYATILGLLIGQQVDEHKTLVKPATIDPGKEINRPETLWFENQRKSMDIQSNLITAKNRPKASLFLQAGLGRPALNMLDNSVKGYYLGGLRLSWPLAGFYTLKNERALNDVNRNGINIQEETFRFNTQMVLSQQNAEILRLKELLSSDDEIISLRVDIKNTALIQMENGVITPNDYLHEVYAEDNARQTKILHEIQLLTALYNQLTTSGI